MVGYARHTFTSAATNGWAIDLDNVPLAYADNILTEDVGFDFEVIELADPQQSRAASQILLVADRSLQDHAVDGAGHRAALLAQQGLP